MKELPPQYNPHAVEDARRDFWERNHLFHAKYHRAKKPYTIVIPPPNVTGILHMGHALNNTLQDIMIRYKRMKGFEALWMPGTDHAGIATQNVVEKQLAKEGKTRHDLTREAFTQRLWDWKKQYGDTIIHQLKKLGSSCDWDRTRFTMDEDYSKAVKTVFIKLHKKGLIYRGQYIINWCPRCQTALSDEEAEHQDTSGMLYHIKYPFKNNPKKYIIVATTRPETMLGDTAVAVHPKDARYKDFIGQTLTVPLMDRDIKIIADTFVDPQFGTGAVKVTPAHDPNDFEMGKRHNLAFINILENDAKLNKNAGPFCGLDRFKAREVILENLKALNLLERTEPHAHAVGHCYRCHTIVEPFLSRQWFVKMKPLAKRAIDVVKKKKIKFYPDRWTKVYLNWMENIRDWCISRQIWWGHRIPVWYCSACGEERYLVSEDKPQRCPKCHGKDLYQDPDVLDTWFSSWLWPFATLNWPKQSQDLKYFYPTATLFTAPEIIFFWVARMVMAGLEFKGKIPFSDVYLHGTVRDTQGRKMSKSLGNAIDPLEIINEYGADALRFSLIINSGQDLFISKEKFEIGRNFANKIWNASRLILMNTSSVEGAHLYENFRKLNTKELPVACLWILSKLQTTTKDLEDAIEKYRFSEAESLIYDFIWKHFCDWYLEMIKNDFTKKDVQLVSVYVLDHLLRLVHPFMPFVSEEIWQKLNISENVLSLQSWPRINKKLHHPRIEKQMESLFDFIIAVRNIRAHWHIQNATTVRCLLQCSLAEYGWLDQNLATIKSLARVEGISLVKEIADTKDMATAISGKIKFYIPLKGIIDLTQEKKRIKTEIESCRQTCENLSKRLSDDNFTKRAPKEVVEKERKRFEDLDTKIKEFEKTLSELS
ncbi:MAG: valine--tRNA ligase [Candidatus Omnitrophota bacterium]